MFVCVWYQANNLFDINLKANPIQTHEATLKKSFIDKQHVNYVGEWLILNIQI